MPGEKTESPKWWVDQSKVARESQKGSPLPPALARFYVTTRGYEQDRARSGLVDLNLKLLSAVDPAPGEIGYLNLIEERSPAALIDKVKRAVPLPPNARGVLVDAGRMMRVILTGEPFGERVLEFNFNKGEPSFDVWIRGEWKEEIVFRNLGELYRRTRGLVDRYLGRDAVAAPEFLA